jgi:hypothetical protein
VNDNLVVGDGLSFPVSLNVFRFGFGFGSRTARSLLDRDDCAFVCDAPASTLATCEAELLELWLLAELDDEDELEPPE